MWPRTNTLGRPELEFSMLMAQLHGKLGGCPDDWRKCEDLLTRHPRVRAEIA